MSTSTILQFATALVLPLATLGAGFWAGRRGRSITVATTLDKEWLNAVADDLAEFTELQYDIIWKRWRLKLYELTAPESSSPTYDRDAFRLLQEASWKQTFRSDFLKSRLMLLLDDRDPLHLQLMNAIETYAAHADSQLAEDNLGTEERLSEVATSLGRRLRSREKVPLLALGRQVLRATRATIRRSV